MTTTTPIPTMLLGIDPKTGAVDWQSSLDDFLQSNQDEPELCEAARQLGEGQELLAGGGAFAATIVRRFPDPTLRVVDGHWVAHVGRCGVCGGYEPRHDMCGVCADEIERQAATQQVR